jgi:hypothetical protein
MREPPSAFVTSCGNRLTSFFGGSLPQFAVLGWLTGGQIGALAIVGRPGMAGWGSDRALAIVCRPATADAGRAVLRRRTCRRAHPAPLRAPLTSPADA